MQRLKRASTYEMRSGPAAANSSLQRAYVRAASRSSRTIGSGPRHPRAGGASNGRMSGHPWTCRLTVEFAAPSRPVVEMCACLHDGAPEAIRGSRAGAASRRVLTGAWSRRARTMRGSDPSSPTLQNALTALARAGYAEAHFEVPPPPLKLGGRPNSEPIEAPAHPAAHRPARPSLDCPAHDERNPRA